MRKDSNLHKKQHKRKFILEINRFISLLFIITILKYSHNLDGSWTDHTQQSINIKLNINRSVHFEDRWCDYTGVWHRGQVWRWEISDSNARCLHALHIQNWYSIRGRPVTMQAGNLVSQFGQEKDLLNEK